MAEKDDSLWSTIAGFFGFGDEGPSAREREMVMSPAPAEPVLKQKPGEDNTAFAIRRRQAKSAWNTEMFNRENYPNDFMVPAAEAAPAPETKEESRYNRANAIDQAVKDLGG